MRALMGLGIHSAGTLFGFRGAGDLEPTDPDVKSAVSIARTAGMLGAFTAIALGIWLFYRGVTSTKKLNLQTFGGLFLFSAGVGNMRNLLNPEAAAGGYALMAGGQFVKKGNV